MWWWRLLVTALLAAILGLLLWDRDRVLEVVSPSPPHESYRRSLDAAGLGDTALARDWIAAAERALREPDTVSLPIQATVRHLASEPRAYGFRLDLKRGRVLETRLRVEGDQPGQVFIDLFRVEPDGPEHVAHADRGSLHLRHEIRRDGTYILRLQPELLRGGSLRMTHDTSAALAFPVAGRDVSAVRSYFRDPRDGGRREHHGLDIFAPRGTPVLAAADGLVTSVGTNRLGGNVVWIWDPARGQTQYYAHLSSWAVDAGERVRAGDVVGYVGNTGNARTTPPHLHFGIYVRREGPIDPLPFVSGAKGPQRGGDPGPPGAKPGQESTGIGG
jgi:murein DD-endopeptidase MepM/ murein hydrolase activator NlpD